MKNRKRSNNPKQHPDLQQQPLGKCSKPRLQHLRSSKRRLCSSSRDQHQGQQHHPRACHHLQASSNQHLSLEHHPPRPSQASSTTTQIPLGQRNQQQKIRSSAIHRRSTHRNGGCSLSMSTTGPVLRREHCLESKIPISRTELLAL